MASKLRSSPESHSMTACQVSAFYNISINQSSY